jgi:uncharacterized membrane protein
LPERPWRSPLLLAGLAIWAVCLTLWGFVWTASREQALAIAATFGAFFIAGKVAAIPTGNTLGLSDLVIGLTVSLPDIGAVLFTYPLMMSGIRFLGRWSGFIRRLHEDAEKAAARREGFVHRFGSVGLFLMALSPLGFYSPLLVSAVGQIMGLSAPRVLVPVILGMVVMTVILVTTLGAGLAAVAQIDSRLPFVFSIALLVTFITIDGVKRYRRRRKERESREKPPV